MAYRRRSSRWWSSVGIWGWWSGTQLRGIVSLGSVTTTEFRHAFRRHGELRLRPIEGKNVRVEVYGAVRSIAATWADQRSARYQSLKIAIEPVAVPVFCAPKVSNGVYEPMAILF